MDRRRFTSFLASTVLVGDSFAVQPAKLHRIGYLGGTPPSAEPYLFEGFFQGLRELGYVEGQNFLLEGRYYGDRVERLPALAAELVQLKVDVIVAGGPPAPEAAQRATRTIQSSWPTTPIPSAARLMNVQLQVLDVLAPGDIDSAFFAMIKYRSHALIVLGSSMFFADRARIVALAFENRLPSMHLLKQYVEAGGLMSYGASNRESMQRAAAYVDKVLKGAKPADLSIEQATKLELNLNLKTAKALGLTIPQGLLQRADQLIQ